MLIPEVIIVALDDMTVSRALEVARRVAGRRGVWGVKMNALLAEKTAGNIISEVKDCGVQVMVDRKIHEIPRSAANWVRRDFEAGADMMTVHASGHIEMMRAAIDAARDEGRRADILAVTALTSLDDEACMDVFNTESKGTVLRLGNLAMRADVDGVVCSVKEVALMRGLRRPDTQAGSTTGFRLRVVPAIRPLWYGSPGDDQRRIGTPRRALDDGATHLVIGTPFFKNGDFLENIDRTVEEIYGIAA